MENIYQIINIRRLGKPSKNKKMHEIEKESGRHIAYNGELGTI